MKFENIMAEVNGFGKFQLRIVLLMTISRSTMPFHFLLNNFIAVVPSHHCDITSLDDGGVFRNLSQAERMIVTIPVKDDGTPNACQMFAEPQYHLLKNSTNITGLPIVPCRNGWIYDNTTFTSTLATTFDLVCERRRLNRTTATIFFIGVMVGAVICGFVSDRFGRKTALLMSYVVTAFFGFASAFSHNFAMFAIMRLFTGMGLAGISLITIVLGIEWADIKHRTAIAILIGLDWSLFTCLLSVVAYFVNDWRFLTATVTSPLILGIICWWWLPESARWLLSNGKVERAHFYLRECAKVNGREQFTADLKPEVLSKVENENRKYSYLDLLKTPKMRKLSFLLAIVWFGIAAPYYGISLNLPGFGVNIYYTQFILGAIEFPAKAFIFFTLTKISRRFNQIGGLFFTGLCILANMFVPHDMWLFKIIVGSVSKMFAEGAFTMLYLYTAELYPTVLRQNGLGWSSSMARIGVAVSPVIFLFEEVWSPLPNIVFSLVAFVAALSASFLPETRNIRLPETIEDVEQRRRRSISVSEARSPS